MKIIKAKISKKDGFPDAKYYVPPCMYVSVYALEEESKKNRLHNKKTYKKRPLVDIVLPPTITNT